MERHRKRHQLAVAVAAVVVVVVAVAALRCGRQSDGSAAVERRAGQGAKSVDYARADEALSWANPQDAEVRHSDLGVAEEASSILESYRARGDCVLESWGYLDLSGRVWSCVVYGGSWADVCYVEEDASTGGCEVRVVRFDAEEIERSWAEAQAEGS